LDRLDGAGEARGEDQKNKEDDVGEAPRPTLALSPERRCRSVSR